MHSATQPFPRPPLLDQGTTAQLPDISCVPHNQADSLTAGDMRGAYIRRAPGRADARKAYLAACTDIRSPFHALICSTGRHKPSSLISPVCPTTRRDSPTTGDMRGAYLRRIS